MRTSPAANPSLTCQNAGGQMATESPNTNASPYEDVAEIGSGAYGTVYKARDLRNEGCFVAKKTVHIQNTEEGIPMNAIREIGLLKQLVKFNHPNIVRLLDVYHERHPEGRHIRLDLIFEYIDMDLAKYLDKCPSPGLGPDRIRDLMKQLLSGMDFLHSNRVVHRDIKPQNILVTSNNQLKLADFGLARIYTENMVLTSVVVTLWYRAPEVLLCASYAIAVDLWSLGCIFAELFNRKPLFHGVREGDMLIKIFQKIGLPPQSEWPERVPISWDAFSKFTAVPIEEFVPEMNPLARDLLERFLKFSPDQRITAREALQHPYFNEDLDSFRTSSSLSENSSSDDRTGSPISQ